MFLELDPAGFESLTPIYEQESHIFPLILAVIKRKQPGWAFVDDRHSPAAALIVTRFGFVQLIGKPVSDKMWTSFFRDPKPYLPNYLLWYSPPPRIQILPAAPGNAQVRCRERTRFSFTGEPVEVAGQPAGFEVELLDKEWIAKIAEFHLDIESRFWSSADDFLKHGLGVCVLKDGKVASICYSACVVDGLAEVDVMTRDEYRGRGLASLAVGRFILECLRREITPTWDCFTDNTASMKLALKLGFKKSFSYNFYSFNVPINIGQTDG